MYKCLTRSICVLLVMLLSLTSACALAVTPQEYNRNYPAVLEEGHLYGEACVIIDGDSAEILFSKNARVRMYPASTTKIMTLLLAIESGWGFDTPVVIPPEAADIESDSSTTPVYPGETTTFGDLLYGMMLHSGNDAANAIAVLVAGSIPDFVARMNQRAEELGCVSTHFANAHGYHDENHYSTAYDLALIGREALKHDSIRDIIGTFSYTMQVSPRGEVPLSSSNIMLNPGSSYYYEACIGMKTGTHSNAGCCFVGAAVKDGVTLVTVTLKCQDKISQWVDTIRLYNYGFTCYTPYTLEQMFELTSSRLITTRVSNAHEDDEMGGVLKLNLAQVSDPMYERMVQSGSEKALSAALDDFTDRSVIRLADNLTAPISAGEIVGSFTYTTTDGKVINASVIAGRDIAAQPEHMSVYDVFPFLKVFENPLVSVLAAVIVLLIIILLLYRNAKRRRRERRRRRLYEQRRREYLRMQAEEAEQRRASTRRPGRNGAKTGSARRPARRRQDKDDNYFGDF